MAPLPSTPYTIRIYTPSQLSQQPALVDELTELINESFRAQAEHPLGRAGLRLTEPGQLIEELGPSGLTAVCFSHSVNETPTDAVQTPGPAIGTASIKPWAGDQIWGPVQSIESAMDSGETVPEESVVSVDGDFEVSIVAVKPGIEFRGRGIADKLVDACEQAILQKWVAEESTTLQAQAGTKISPRPIKIMVRVVKEITAPYWAKKKFVTVGERRYPSGTWGFEKDFSMSAMVRELPVPVHLQICQD